MKKLNVFTPVFIIILTLMPINVLKIISLKKKKKSDCTERINKVLYFSLVSEACFPMKEKLVTWNNWTLYLHVCKKQINSQERGRLFKKQVHCSSMYNTHQEAHALTSLLLQQVTDPSCLFPSLVLGIYQVVSLFSDLLKKFCHDKNTCLY